MDVGFPTWILYFSDLFYPIFHIFHLSVCSSFREMSLTLSSNLSIKFLLPFYHYNFNFKGSFLGGSQCFAPIFKVASYSYFLDAISSFVSLGINAYLGEVLFSLHHSGFLQVDFLPRA